MNLCLFQLRHDPLGMLFQQIEVGHLTCMEFHFQAIEARNDVAVEMEYRLARFRAVQLGDHETRRLEGAFDGGRKLVAGERHGGAEKDQICFQPETSG